MKRLIILFLFLTLVCACKKENNNPEKKIDYSRLNVDTIQTGDILKYVKVEVDSFKNDTTFCFGDFYSNLTKNEFYYLFIRFECSPFASAIEMKFLIYNYNNDNINEDDISNKLQRDYLLQLTDIKKKEDRIKELIDERYIALRTKMDEELAGIHRGKTQKEIQREYEMDEELKALKSGHRINFKLDDSSIETIDNFDYSSKLISVTSNNSSFHLWNVGEQDYILLDKLGKSNKVIIRFDNDSNTDFILTQSQLNSIKLFYKFFESKNI